MEFEVAKVGERGQVVIPNVFRKGMHIHSGEKLIVVQRGKMLVFKRLKAPKEIEFERLLRKTHEHAVKNSLKSSDLEEAIQKARKK